MLSQKKVIHRGRFIDSEQIETKLIINLAQPPFKSFYRNIWSSYAHGFQDWGYFVR